MYIHHKMTKKLCFFAFTVGLLLLVIYQIYTWRTRLNLKVQQCDEKLGTNAKKLHFDWIKKTEEYNRAVIEFPDVYNDTILIPEISVLNSMDYKEVAYLYHRYINSLQTCCRRIVRMGKIDDGGWDTCDDYRYRPQSNCLVFSFGINNDFSFDDDISKTYGCKVHAFDPSMGVHDHERSDKISFHSLGLSNTNNPHLTNTGSRWKMGTLTSIKKNLNVHEKKIDILKIDIEMWEWTVLPEMISSGVLDKVTQFVLEFHIVNIGTNSEPLKQKYIEGLSVLRKLYDLGFRIFWTHKNLNCKFFSQFGGQRCGCHEVSFLKLNKSYS